MQGGAKNGVLTRGGGHCIMMPENRETVFPVGGAVRG